jgi:phosphoglycerol transferase MdoB-like AlkP superfamily enzyme
MKTNLQVLVASLFVSLLHFVGQIRSLTTVNNRYMIHWDQMDALVLLTSITIGGVLIASASILFERSPNRKVRSLGQHIFVLLFVNGLYASIPLFGNRPRFMALIWSLTLVAVGISYYKKSEFLHKSAGILSMVFSPLIIILGMQLISWSEWTSPATDFEPKIDESKKSVVVIVFDEWSYSRTFDGNFPRKDLPNLAALAKESYIFNNARSMFRYTQNSVPALMYQTDSKIIIEDEGAYFQFDDIKKSSKDTPSLFSTAKKNGLNTYLWSFHLPYRNILGEAVDHIELEQLEPKGTGFLGRMKNKIERNFANYWQDPLSILWGKKHWKKVYSENWVDINKQFLIDSKKVIDTWPKNSFLFFHSPMPHGPYVLNEVGEYQGPYAGDKWESTIEEYDQHLKYMDLVLGQLISNLKNNNKYEDTLLVVTSDHSWRHDPDVKHDDKSDMDVPLLIKWPNQKLGYTVSSSIKANELKTILKMHYLGRSDSVLKSW